MLKKSVLFVFILGSIHMFGASLSKDDAEVINDMMGPHYRVLLTEGKDAFIEKVCSTWLKEQVRPEELLWVVEKKAKRHAQELGFSDHWLVKGMASYVEKARLCQEQGCALSLLTTFMDYMTVCSVNTTDAEEQEQLERLKQACGVTLFGGAPEDFEAQLEEGVLDHIDSRVLHCTWGVMRFCEKGQLPMAECLALYSRHLIPMPLTDLGHVHTLGLQAVKKSILKVPHHCAAMGRREEFILYYPTMARVGIDQAWSDIMGVSGIDQMWRVFLHYQLNYEGYLKLLYHCPRYPGWGDPSYKKHVEYLRKYGVLDKESANAANQDVLMSLHSVVKGVVHTSNRILGQQTPLPVLIERILSEN